MLSWPDNIHILIPAYKSADSLSKFLPHLLQIVPAENICVVDDASEDKTDEVCSQFHITCLKHAVNSGKGAALKTGFKYLLHSHSRWIITMDADGQHSPGDLGVFVDAVSRNPSLGICIGARTMKPGIMPVPRILSNVITSRILSLFTATPILDSQCGYRVYSSELLKKITFQYNRFEMETEAILKAVNCAFPVCFVQVQTLYLNGQSHISHLSDTIRWIKAVIKINSTLKSRPKRDD